MCNLKAQLEGLKNAFRQQKLPQINKIIVKIICHKSLLLQNAQEKNINILYK